MSYIRSPLAFDHLLWNMGGGGHSTTTTTQELSPEQRSLLEGVIPIAKNFLANPPKQYAGSAIAGFNPLQQSAQQMTLNAANSMLPQVNKIPGQINALNQGWGNLQQGFGQNANAFGQNATAFGGNAAAFGANANRFTGNANAFGQNAAAFGQNAGAFNQVQRYGQQAIGAAQQGVRGAGDIMSQIQAMISGVQPGTNFLTSGDVLRPESNPALRGAIDAASRSTIENFNQQIMPGLTSSSLGAGGYGGTRQGIAEGLAASGASQTLGDISSSMANTNYQAGLQAMLGGLNAAQGQRGDILAGGDLANQAAGQLAQTMLGGGQLQNQSLMGQTNALQGQTGALQGQTGALVGQTGALQGQTGALQGQTGALQGQTGALQGQGGALTGQQNLLGNMGQILQQMFLPAQFKEAVGAQQQMMAQARLSEEVQKFVNQQMIPFSAAQDVAAMAFGMPGGTTRSESTGGQGGAGGMLQGIGSVAGAVLPLLMKSDRRLKKDIIKIGEEKGLGVYSFKYKGTNFPMVGFMADEVEELYPENVFTDVTGYKGVKYGEMQWLNN